MHEDVQSYIGSKLFSLRGYRVKRKNVDTIIEYFERVNQLGESCTDLQEFVEKYEGSPLEKELDTIASNLEPTFMTVISNIFKGK